MKEVNSYPPNITLIRFAFPYIPRGTTFAYGDTIYNPDKRELTKDVIHHEAVHSQRQGDNPDFWWYKYINDEEFRLQEEILAYGEQYLFSIKAGVSGKLKDWVLEKLAGELSNSTYGNLITFGEAQCKLKQYVKART